MRKDNTLQEIMIHLENLMFLFWDSDTYTLTPKSILQFFWTQYKLDSYLLKSTFINIERSTLQHALPLELENANLYANSFLKSTECVHCSHGIHNAKATEQSYKAESHCNSLESTHDFTSTAFESGLHKVLPFQCKQNLTKAYAQVC